MATSSHRIAFGPIPSRRLGRSLGVNTIPPKSCSYDCIYCQVGPTTDSRIEPRGFFSPEEVSRAVRAHLQRLRERDEPVDFLTFVPDGEPTLDIDLDATIEALQPLGIPIAVITNSSLLTAQEVRARLARADLVSVKVDSASEEAWRAVNRPHPGLRLAEVLDGVRAFAAQFDGTLLSETMLVAGCNDGEASLRATADFLAEIRPRTAYLAVPTRPPSVAGTGGPPPQRLQRAQRIFAARLPRVELLTGAEPAPFATTGDAREDLLAITAVHAMRASAVQQLLTRDGSDWDLVQSMVAAGELEVADHGGERFYLRTSRGRP